MKKDWSLNNSNYDQWGPMDLPEHEEIIVYFRDGTSATGHKHSFYWELLGADDPDDVVEYEVIA